MTDAKKNLDFLRKCGIQEYILGDDSAWKGFIDFFQNDISESNILTEEELFELSAQETDDDVMPDAELIKRKNQIAKEYNGIWTLTENDVTLTQKQFDCTKEIEDEYNQLILEARRENINTTEDLASLEVCLGKWQTDDAKVSQRCHKQMEELEQMKLTVERKVIELGQLYAQPSKNMLFMHQMPLNDYFTKLDTFNKAAEQYTRRNFNVADAGDEHETAKDISDKKMYEELNKVADRLLNAYHRIFLEQMKANGKTKLIEQLKHQNWTPSTLTAIKHEIAEMDREENNINLMKNDLMMKMQEQAIELARLDVESVIFDNNKKRSTRADQRKQHIIRFVDAVAETMIIAEIIWILMQFDMERMKKRNDFDPKLDKYRIDTIICDRRLDMLKASSQTNNDALLRNYCQMVLKLLQPSRTDRDTEFSSDRIVECLLSIHEFKSELAAFLQRLGDKTKYLVDDLEFYERSASNQKVLLKHLNDGPVDKHQYWTVEYLKMKTQLAERLGAVSVEVGSLKEESRVYIQKMSNDNLWSQKQTLWIWFLTEPKKVIKAIKLAKTVAQRQPTNDPTKRPLAGLLRKN